MGSALIAGAATVDITPDGPQFLFGYPHVRRFSTGVHDPLLSSALFLSDGQTSLLLVANDVIYVSRRSAQRVRERIEQQTGIPAANIMITATHTHSGPMTVDILNNEADPAVPKTDLLYVEWMEDRIVESAVQAFRNAKPACIGFATADGSCVGGNRHDPAGPSNPETPVMVMRDRDTHAYIAMMLVCSMHPTVLHEDSTLVSGDFPAMARQYLQEHAVGRDCPVIYHTGPCGDQSPRHVTQANTFDEAARLGCLLGQSIVKSLDSVIWTDQITLGCVRDFVQLPPRKFSSVEEAKKLVEQAAKQLEALRQSAADPRQVRTAECDWFGAEEALTLAHAAMSGQLQEAVDAVMPAEIICMRIGHCTFVGWPGESFVEFTLKLKALHHNCHVLSMANGELQGYLVSEEAVQQHWYEAMNSLFECPRAGMMLVDKTSELVDSLLSDRQ